MTAPQKVLLALKYADNFGDMGRGFYPQLAKGNGFYVIAEEDRLELALLLREYAENSAKINNL